MFEFFNSKLYKLLHSKPADIIPVGRHLARVIDIYDGDTITVAIIHKKIVFQYNVRIYGIDTPELKYKGLNKQTENQDTPEIKRLKELRAKGFAAKDRLVRLIGECPNDLVYLDCRGREKYGRLLADVWPAERVGVCLSCWPANNIRAGKKTFADILIAEGHGVPYTGGKRDDN